MKKWPEHFPKQCPPAHAVSVFGDIYRFTNRVTPNIKYFRTYYEIKLDNDWGDKACQARGFSVYSSQEECNQAALMVPALEKKKIAVAKLNADHGVIANTPSISSNEHKTFWSFIDSEQLTSLFVNYHLQVSSNV